MSFAKSWKRAAAVGAGIMTTSIIGRSVWHRRQQSIDDERIRRYETTYGPSVLKSAWTSERSAVEAALAVRPFVRHAVAEKLASVDMLAKQTDKLIAKRTAIETEIGYLQKRDGDLQSDLMAIDIDRSAWLAAEERWQSKLLAERIRMAKQTAEIAATNDIERLTAATLAAYQASVSTDSERLAAESAAAVESARLHALAQRGAAGI